jgi:hypothetical protein
MADQRPPLLSFVADDPRATVDLHDCGAVPARLVRHHDVQHQPLSGGLPIQNVARDVDPRPRKTKRHHQSRQWKSSRVVQVWETRERVVEYVMRTSPVVEEHEQAQPRSDCDAHTRDARPDGEGAKLHEQHRGD